MSLLSIVFVTRTMTEGNNEDDSLTSEPVETEIGTIIIRDNDLYRLACIAQKSESAPPPREKEPKEYKVKRSDT